jgi:TatD DNase family protein
MLVDSHCHLNFKDFDGDLDQVISRAREGGIDTMQTICTRISDFKTILEIAKKYKNIYCSVGIHPHEVDNELAAAGELIKLAESDYKVIGLGETGLDYYYKHGGRNHQQASFMEHIKAAQATNKPIIVHTRDAEDDTYGILKKGMEQKQYKGLIHCFTASRKFAEKCLDLGLYISISGIVTFKKAVELQEIVKFLPLDRLLVETDSPYLAPVPCRGKRNEPAFTKHTAKFIAKLKNISLEEVASVTTANFNRLFLEK